MKQIIRKQMKNIRNNLSKNIVKTNSKYIFDKLFQLDLNLYNTFFIYKNFGNEIETDEIILRLLLLKKRVFIPQIDNNLMKSVEINEKSTFKENKFRILETQSNPEEIDNFVAIMPCLAVDKQGNRIGFGGGFYDKFLANKNALKIVICHNFQLLDKIEANSYDIPVDYIITEKRTVICKNTAL